MDPTHLSFHYERDADILYVHLVAPYAAQESDELGCRRNRRTSQALPHPTARQHPACQRFHPRSTTTSQPNPTPPTPKKPPKPTLNAQVSITEPEWASAAGSRCVGRRATRSQARQSHGQRRLGVRRRLRPGVGRPSTRPQAQRTTAVPVPPRTTAAPTPTQGVPGSSGPSACARSPRAARDARHSHSADKPAPRQQKIS